MKLILNIDRIFKETRVTIEGPELDENIQEIIDFIHGREQQFLIGKKGEKGSRKTPLIDECLLHLNLQKMHLVSYFYHPYM